MKSLGEIKKEKEDKVSALIAECLMFFAFSDEQFAESKTQLQPGEKYVHIGAGAYMPKSKVDTYITGMASIKKWYKEAIKESNLRKQNIEYALNNHEAHYTGDIEPALVELGSDYTAKEVMEVLQQTPLN